MISKNTIKLVKSLELKKNRLQKGLFVAEGPKVVGDLMSRMTPHIIIATREWIACHGGHDTEIVEVTDDELTKVSFMQHPQQVVALFPVMANSDEAISDSLSENGLYLALDGVRDPGNMGTIIRIADWFGIDAVICSRDTADVYNPKVVQATMGSIARVRVLYTDLEAVIDRMRGQMPIYGTLLDGDDIYLKSLSANGIIVFGNEGKGISVPIREKLTDRLLIPRFGNEDAAESLNVAIATAITCSEFRRRRK